MDTTKDISQKDWDQLANKKIYFGHQSVGNNMVDGLASIIKEHPNIKLEIEESNSIKIFDSPVFAHSRNGQNGDPKSKIDNFCKAMEDGLGDKVDMAGFKFCYVDFKKGTDVKNTFSYYKSKMDEISLKFPNVKIIHYTVPLSSIRSGPKALIKKIIGKDIGIDDNVIRNEFNELLKSEYNINNIFDLTKFESTYPDGKREYLEIDGKKVFTMIPSYTNDGGHLSKKGKYIIGGELLIFLAKLSDGRQN